MVADVSCGRRERKKAQTRDRLTAAALRLALEHGPDDVTVEQIAEAADVSPRTFFNYFPSKWDAIVDFDLSEKHELAAAVLARPASEPPLEVLRQVFVSRSDAQVEEFNEMRARMELVERHDVLHHRFLQYFAMFEQGLVDAVAERLDVDPVRDPYPRLLVAAVSAAIRAAFHHHTEDPSGRTLVDAFDEAFAVLASGFVPPAIPSDPLPDPPSR